MQVQIDFSKSRFKNVVQTFFVLVVTFILSSLSLFIGFILKNLNPNEYGLIQGRKEDLEITYKEILFFASIVFTFFVLSLSLRYIKNQKVKLLLIFFTLLYLTAAFLMVLIDCVYYLIFAYRITFSAVQTALNTNPEEAEGFIKLYATPARITMLLIFIALILLIIFRRDWFVRVFSTRTFFITVSLCSAFGIIDFIQMAHAEGNGLHNMRYWDIMIGEYNEYREFNRELQAEKDNHNLSEEYKYFYNADTLPKTLVLVISESLSKKHMSLYGYTRKTTPYLDTNKTIYTFNNCVTQSPITIEAVPGLFFYGHLSKKINLITLCNKLGYETTWLSNQSGWGKGDRTIVLLSQLCNKKIFMDARSEDQKSNASIHYDEDVLKELDHLLTTSKDKSKLIIVHLMGCHYDYEKRYPANKNVFKSDPPIKLAVNTVYSRNMINSYDNAMLFHDSVVNEIATIFLRRSLNSNAALLFLSDHGEELYDNRDHSGHGYPPCKATAEIPFFTMLSPGFKNAYPRVDQVMKTRCNTPYSTSNNLFTFLHLLNIHSKKYNTKIKNNAFFSSNYDSTGIRSVMGFDYDKLR